jgi:hypothetical protein
VERRLLGSVRRALSLLSNTARGHSAVRVRKRERPGDPDKHDHASSVVDANFDQDRNRDAHAGSDWDGNCYTHARPDTDGDALAHASSDADLDFHPHGGADAHADPRLDGYRSAASVAD